MVFHNEDGNPARANIKQALGRILLRWRWNFHVPEISSKYRDAQDRTKRKDTEVPQPSGPTTNIADEAVNEEMDDSLERVATTATSLDAKQDSGNINKTQSKATLNELSSIGTSSGSGPRRQETMGDTIAQTRSENVSKLSNDPLLAREFLIWRQQRPLKVGLSRRVESSDKEGLGEVDASKQGRIHDIDADAGINLVSTHFDADIDMFGVHDFVGDEVVIESEVAVKAGEKINVVEEVVSVASTIPVNAATITTKEITLAKALADLKSEKPKAKGIVFRELVESTTIIPTITTADETNLGSSPSWDDVQAKIEADYQLARRLQAQEQEELTNEEKARLFVQFLEQRRKHFSAKRAEEKRNKPPTRAQQRSVMCTYLKNMEGWKPKSLKTKSFANIQELFDKAMKRVNAFVDYMTNLVEESSKKAEAEVMEDEEEVAIDVVPLATKPPTIVDWKIHKEEKKSYYQIIRADGKSQMYKVFSQMLKSFSREDLEDLYKLVKARYGSTMPVEDLDLILYGDLKTMFEPHVEDQVWKNQDDYNVLDWKLYDSCGVHSLRMQHAYIHMLVEKKYPPKASIITDMLNKKLQGRIVGIKRLLDDLKVTVAKLMMLVYKLLLLVLKVNAASINFKTAQRLRLLNEFLLSEKG
ncbi:hypothetical protein Tco_0228354 [Tanacetum coccineum]